MDPLMMYLTVGVSLIDAALAGILLFIYGREYARVRAPFTLGLVMFAGFFLAQNLLAAYGYLVLMVFLPDNVQPIMLAIMVLEALALGVMAFGAAALPSRRERKADAGIERGRPAPVVGSGALQVPQSKGR